MNFPKTPVSFIDLNVVSALELANKSINNLLVLILFRNLWSISLSDFLITLIALGWADRLFLLIKKKNNIILCGSFLKTLLLVIFNLPLVTKKPIPPPEEINFEGNSRIFLNKEIGTKLTLCFSSRI